MSVIATTQQRINREIRAREVRVIDNEGNQLGVLSLNDAIQAAWDRDLLDFTRRAITLRRAYPALRRGSFESLYAHEDVIAFARQARGSTAVVAFNAGHETRTISVDVDDYLPDGTWADAWDGLSGRVYRGALRDLVLPPRSTAVFVNE